MINLFLNNDFEQASLIPNLENIKRYLHSINEECEFFNFESLAQLKTLDLKGKVLIRCDLNFGANSFSQLSMAPEAVRFSGTFDSLTLENEIFLPRVKYFDVLRRKIVTHFGNIEIKESAGLICDSVAQEGLVSVLVSLGFRTIILFVPDGTDNVGAKLSQYFIGVNIKTISFSKITQNQDSTSLIINSVDLEKNVTLMNDLAYFNFMSSKGIIVDLASKTPIHPLLFEAEKAGLRVMKRQDVCSFYDYESLKQVWEHAEKSKEDFFGHYLEIETIDQ